MPSRLARIKLSLAVALLAALVAGARAVSLASCLRSTHPAGCLGRGLDAALHAALTAAVAAFIAVTAAALAWRALGGPSREQPRPAREAIPTRVRHEVWRRDGGACVECGSRERLEYDHIVPVARGGANSARNIELRCQRCNRRKGAAV